MCILNQKRILYPSLRHTSLHEELSKMTAGAGMLHCKALIGHHLNNRSWRLSSGI